VSLTEKTPPSRRGLLFSWRSQYSEECVNISVLYPSGGQKRFLKSMSTIKKDPKFVVVFNLMRRDTTLLELPA
jgi:hypothetical protein